MKASALTRTNALAALLVISLQLPSFAANQTLHVSPQGNDAWSGRLADANRNQTVTDNHFHTLGRIYPPAIGIFILQSGTNRVAHNHIHDLYYTAVSVGWNWGYQETPCRENLIELNHMHDIGQSMLSDMGAVYTLGIQHGTVVRNNLIHDVSSFTYGGWGLYPDEGSTGIVYFGSGTLLGSSWKNERFVIDHNLYFDTRTAAASENFKFADTTLDKWRARGHDTHSLIADPLFVAPDQFDFRLRKDSPALARGFKPIDLTTVGVRPPEKRSDN